MTTERIDADDRQGRLDWMRAEFRAAQQRRYERRHAIAKEVRVAEPTSGPEAEPPTLAPLSPNASRGPRVGRPTWPRS